MSEESTVDNAESTPATDEITAPSADENQIPESDQVIKTENTQKRFNQLAGERDQERDKNDVLIQQNSELMSRVNRLESRTLDLGYEDQGAPKADDFDDEIEFASAKGAYDATKNMVGLLQTSQQNQQIASQQATLNNQIAAYNQKVAKVQEKHPDFQQVTANGLLVQNDSAGNLTPSAQALLEVENGPETYFHIQSNPQVAAKLNLASPTQAAILIKEISDKFKGSQSVDTLPSPIGSEDTGTGVAPTSDGLLHIGGATFE